jgi:hypothetical protein
LKTSYFAKLSQVRAPLSISGRAPDFYKGPQFKTLAPKYEFFAAYKAGEIDSDGYTSEFRRLVLAPLNPRLLYDRLHAEHGPEVTLLCYEKPGDFCHRRLVAEWFEQELGVSVPELTFGPPPKESTLLIF